jgi:hypothetical protein
VERKRPSESDKIFIWPPGPKARSEPVSEGDRLRGLCARILTPIVLREVEGRKPDGQQLKANDKLDLRDRSESRGRTYGGQMRMISHVPENPYSPCDHENSSQFESASPYAIS